MITKELFEHLEKQNVGRCSLNEPLCDHTTFKIGGPCDVMVFPSTIDQISNAIRFFNEHQVAYMIIGNGSNLLISDQGLEKAIIKIGDNFADVKVIGETVVAQAGALLSAVAKKAMAQDLTHIEFASGIPGTIGGAVTMNAGAYNGEMKEIIKEVKVLTREGELLTIEGKDMNFRYRNSRVQDEGLIVVETTLSLEKGNPSEIKALYDDLTFKRTSKQPLEYPSAGSVFKRPEGYFAGKLIQDSGLRGYRVNNAMVSEKHCGFIITVGDSSFKEVITVIRDVQRIVKEKQGVDLKTEIKIIEE